MRALQLVRRSVNRGGYVAVPAGKTRSTFPQGTTLREENKLGYWRTNLWYCTHMVVRHRTIIPNARMKNSALVCCGEMI